MSHKSPSRRSQPDRTRLLLLAITAVMVVGAVVAFGLRAEDSTSDDLAATQDSVTSPDVTSPDAGTSTGSGAVPTSSTAPTVASGATTSPTTQPGTDDTTPSTTQPQTGDTAPATTLPETDSSVPTQLALDCEALPPVTPSALGMSTFEADVDADGSPDTVSVYLDPEAFIWRLRVEFAAGLGSDTPIADPGSDIGAAALGAYDIEGDGPMEIFIRNGGEPDSFSIELFGVIDCVVDPLLIDQEAAVFPMSFGNDEVSGLACEDNQLLRKFATRSGTSVSFGGGTETYNLANRILTSTGTALQTRSTTGAFAIAAIDCPGVANS